jgi:hypothetical protein
MQQNFPEPLNCTTCGRIHTPITNQGKDKRDQCMYKCPLTKVMICTVYYDKSYVLLTLRLIIATSYTYYW